MAGEETKDLVAVTGETRVMSTLRTDARDRVPTRPLPPVRVGRVCAQNLRRLLSQLSPPPSGGNAGAGAGPGPGRRRRHGLRTLHVTDLPPPL